MNHGIWSTIEALTDGLVPAAVLAEWRWMANGEFASVGSFLRTTQRLAVEYPCLHETRCGCRHEVDSHDGERWFARCQCDTGDCPSPRLTPSDLIIHELDAARFGGAVARTLGFEPAENIGLLRAAPKLWPAGTHAATRSPVYLALCPTEGELVANLVGLTAARQEPFVVLAPTASVRSETVNALLSRLHGAFIPLANCLAADGPGELRVTGAIEPVLERFAAGLAQGNGLARTVEKIGSDIEAVARNQYELRRENDEIGRLHADGNFKFALKVDDVDFQAFAVIVALGHRKAAADFLKVPHRSFYDRVDQWQSRGREYQLMWRFIEWRKRSSRQLKVKLDESVQSGEAGGAAETPETLREG